MGTDGVHDTVIFDLDGTLFRGRTAIPGAIDALKRLRKRVVCRFLSNNGERLGEALAERLRGFGFTVDPEEVISSADLVLKYVRDRGQPVRILALSSPELANALAAQGNVLVDDESADLIVVGVDRTLTRERMVNGLRAALNGAVLVATNEDPTYPGGDGLRPAAGAYVGFFRGMGFEPVHFCGKPDEWAVRTALAQWGISDASRCLFVGDNLRTDIAAANRIRADSALVLTGVSAKADIPASGKRPTIILESVAALDSDCLEEIDLRRKSRAGEDGKLLVREKDQ